MGHGGFAAIEFVAVRYPEKCPPIAGFYARWSPRDLPPLEPPAAGGLKRRSYFHAVTEVIFGFIFLAWLLLVPEYPYLMFGPGVAYIHASPFHAAPIVMTFYWWVVALNAIQLAWNCVDLMRGAWQKTQASKRIAFKSIGLIPILILLNAPDRVYVLLKHPEMDLARYGQTLDTLNHTLHSAFLLICVIVALQLAWEIIRAMLQAFEPVGGALISQCLRPDAVEGFAFRAAAVMNIRLRAGYLPGAFGVVLFLPAGTSVVLSGVAGLSAGAWAAALRRRCSAAFCSSSCFFAFSSAACASVT